MNSKKNSLIIVDKFLKREDYKDNLIDVYEKDNKEMLFYKKKCIAVNNFITDIVGLNYQYIDDTIKLIQNYIVEKVSYKKLKIYDNSIIFNLFMKSM